MGHPYVAYLTFSQVRSRLCMHGALQEWASSSSMPLLHQLRLPLWCHQQQPAGHASLLSAIAGVLANACAEPIVSFLCYRGCCSGVHTRLSVLAMIRSLARGVLTLCALCCAEEAAAGQSYGQEDSQDIRLGGSEGGGHLHSSCREHRAPRGAQAGLWRTTAGELTISQCTCCVVMLVSELQPSNTVFMHSGIKLGSSPCDAGGQPCNMIATQECRHCCVPDVRGRQVLKAMVSCVRAVSVSRSSTAHSMNLMYQSSPLYCL